MTGMIDKIKGKVIEGFTRALTIRIQAPARPAFTRHTLYDLFHPPQTPRLIDVATMTKDNILSGAAKLNDVLVYSLDSKSFNEMQLRVAVYDLICAIEAWDESDSLILDDTLLCKLADYKKIQPFMIKRLEDKLVNRQGMFEWGDADLHEAIKRVTHFGDRLQAILKKWDIHAAQPLPALADYIAPFPKTPPKYDPWRLKRQ